MARGFGRGGRESACHLSSLTPKGWATHMALVYRISRNGALVAWFSDACEGRPAGWPARPGSCHNNEETAKKTH